MRSVDVSIPEIAFVAATRGMVGAGIGLLVAEYLDSERRKAVGWTLLTIGLITTVPIAATLIGRSHPRLLAD